MRRVVTSLPSDLPRSVLSDCPPQLYFRLLSSLFRPSDFKYTALVSFIAVFLAGSFLVAFSLPSCLSPHSLSPSFLRGLASLPRPYLHRLSLPHPRAHPPLQESRWGKRSPVAPTPRVALALADEQGGRGRGGRGGRWYETAEMVGDGGEIETGGSMMRHVFASSGEEKERDLG